MAVRMRITVNSTGQPRRDMQIASDLRRDIWAYSKVKIDPDHPLHGIHRDEHGRAYFEFSADIPDDVRRVIRDYDYSGSVELTETSSLFGEECVNCGNVSGPERLTVCPNCHFRDITPCPICEHEISRESYIEIGSNFFQCPNCGNQVRLRYNNPMFLPDGHYNAPLVLVDKVMVVHGI